MRRAAMLLLVVVLVLGSAPAGLVSAQEGYRPAPENLAARQWFQDARFGLFIHWGAYAVAGRGEWVMHQERITIPEYERDFPPAFDPAKFAADYDAVRKLFK